MNSVTLHGNVTADPTIRYTPSGRAIAGFTIAANSRRYNRDEGRWVDLPAVFHRVAAFGDLAENLVESVAKGTTVTVTGEFVDASYTPAGSDQLRRAVQLNATDVAVSLRFATATVTRNPKRAPAGAQPTGSDTTGDTGADPSSAPEPTSDPDGTGEQVADEPPARPVRGVNRTPRGRQLHSVS
jgi:single-strand DNA-binding protein